MTEINVIKFLLDEVEQEQVLLDKYKVDYAKAEKEAQQAIKDGKLRAYAWEYLNWKGRYPKKSIITANMRKIRLLSMKIIKEAEVFQ
jgi:hypothetical protein